MSMTRTTSDHRASPGSRSAKRLGDLLEKRMVPRVALAAGEQRQIENVHLDQVVEEMRSQRDVGHEVFAHGDDFAEDGDGVDLGEADGHAERRRRGAPAAWTDEEDVFGRARLVEMQQPADQASHRVAIADGKLSVDRRRDVDQPVDRD